MKIEDRLRREILEKVARFYAVRSGKNMFIPGKTAINYAGRCYDKNELVNLVDASLDFWLTAGRYANKFENEFAEFLGVKYCLLVNSGSSANLLAVSALTSPLLKEKSLKPGNEVVTTACGFPTTLNPIIQNGLIPVFVDIELGTYNINVDRIKKAINKKTRAIFIAHTLGNPADMDKLKKIAEKYDLWLIEDSCDALGSKYKRRYTGGFGDIATFSFYPAHHITMGEGGAVVTSNPLLNKILLSFRGWGRDCLCKPGVDNSCGKRFSHKFGQLPIGYDHKYIYSHIGYNLKLTDMQAAVGCAQLNKLPGFIQKRIKNFKYLLSYFRKYEDYFILPKEEQNAAPSWFGFPILVRKGSPFDRRTIVSHLEQNKIATRMLFAGNLIKQPAYQNIKYKISGNLKNTDAVMDNLFWLGVYPGLTEEKIIYICSVLDNLFSRYNRSNR